LTTWPVTCRAARYGAPLRPCRITTTAAPSASSVRTVSMSDSPLLTELADAETLTTSAPSARAAISKETRVRVDAS
jgi:hypothetical protein